MCTRGMMYDALCRVGAKRKEGGKVREKKTKRSKPEKDPNKPKRPNTAYFLFL